jgi:hypothetical protein
MKVGQNQFDKRPSAATVLAAWALGLLSLAACAPTDIGEKQGSPRDQLPAHITELTELGAAVRPAWSADGSRVLYLDGLVGEVYEYDLASGTARPMTAHFEHPGFSRAHYLANGDLLLCGPSDVDPNDPEKGRWDSDFWYLARSLETPASPLGEPCFEGPAVSRTAMRIAWTRTDYPEESPLTARSELWLGEIDVSGEQPRIVNARKLVDRGDFFYFAMLEPQDFRPPDDEELLFTAYAYRGGEVMGINLETGEIRNYSRSWWYEEVEGVSPVGDYAAVEREFTLTLRPEGEIDIWALRLDGSGEFTRLTHFSDFEGFGANNPVISPDCSKMIFAIRQAGGLEGNSDGLFLYDLKKSPLTPSDMCNHLADARADQ